MVDLMPCPFCQSDQAHVMVGLREDRGFSILCGKCGIRQGSANRSKAEAIAAWNTRPPATQADDALVEELARAICRAWVYCDLDKPDGQNRWIAEKSQRMAEARAIIPILHRERAAAHAAGRAAERAEVAAWLHRFGRIRRRHRARPARKDWR